MVGPTAFPWVASFTKCWPAEVPSLASLDSRKPLLPPSPATTRQFLRSKRRPTNSHSSSTIVWRHIQTTASPRSVTWEKPCSPSRRASYSFGTLESLKTQNKRASPLAFRQEDSLNTHTQVSKRENG